MARIFTKHIIGFRTFFAPAESIALNQLFADMAEWQAEQIAKGKFIPVEKFKPRLLDGLMILGNKKAIMETLDPRTPKAIRRLAVAGKVARPALNVLGGQFLSLSTRQFGGLIGLSLNLLRVSPIDVVISAAFAFHELRFQDFETEFGVGEGGTQSTQQTFRGTNIPFAVSRESLGAGFLISETIDQLAFGFVPERGQQGLTLIFAQLLEAPIVAAKFFGGPGELISKARF